MDDGEAQGCFIEGPAPDLPELLEQKIHTGKNEKGHEELPHGKQQKRGPVFHLGFQQHTDIFAVEFHRKISLLG
ncbi:hypothetical protein D3C76_1767130 [compost metagenome]